ncbi:outer membrane beta-barrel protein [Lichenihabitans sp. Uapishka_5]|uniref:outer membrane protein n=1 Tax=Lichenihabitans sp. Uapishka_5 TaxID=3037302 RepID=UPI0029E7F9E3|nr:outer membrane beta-barrel protein [Lichenihabitans sp. Uapishka_5]MDX7953218.1 outer membrane beta-barrel protein [Lichenihabitans sp. Uapishka_5]
MQTKTLITVLVALAGLGGAAQAADLDSFYGQDEDVAPAPNLTFGTGWYLRGDLTATDDRKPNVLGSLDKATQRDWNYGVGGGVGYKLNSYFRTDLTGDYLGPEKTVQTVYGVNETWSAKSNLRRFDVLTNAYLDLGTWAGLTPYIGAGVGVAGVRLDGSYEHSAPLTGGYDYYKISGKTRYDLAWAAMAGVTYNLSQNLLIDVGYRYLDLGSYTVPHYAVSSFNVGSKADLTSHQIRAGLRYMIY